MLKLGRTASARALKQNKRHETRKQSSNERTEKNGATKNKKAGCGFTSNPLALPIPFIL